MIRVWGPRAIEVVDAAFRPARPEGLARTPQGTLRFGRIGAGAGDEVVVTVTDDDPPEVEIHCHGGPAPVALAVLALEAEGVERRQPAAWIRRNARTILEAEAHVDLGRAPTARTAEILLDQMHGALEREVAQMIHMLIYDRLDVLDRLETLIGRAALGLRLVSGWRVVLAGRPNVGKSRLLNALAGYQRAIVDPTAGTTREGATIRTAFDGWPVELTDTAGLRSADDALEAEGIAMARTRQAEADLILLVLDRSEPLTVSDRVLLAADAGRRLVVANKSDLPAAWIAGNDLSVTVSAELGEGIERLVAGLAARLVPAPPPPEAGIPFRPRHPRLLERARDALKRGDMALAHSSLSALIGHRKRLRGSSRRPPA